MSTTAPRAKRQVGDLALFGGPPLYRDPIHVGLPNIGDRERLFERIAAALDHRRLSNGGPLVQEFERRIADLIDVEHAIAVTNATTGLQIAARAVDLREEVIVPSLTFIATPHALEWIGIEPIFGDVQPERLCLDPGAIEALIGPRTTGILATHLWGRTCDTDALGEIAARHGIRLLYDAVHAFTCERDGRPVGSFGDAEVFSFHATKFVNAFEGGLIATNDARIAERARRYRNFGFVGQDRSIGPGINGKMHEASAAMGLTSLEALDEFLAVNRRNEEAYAAHLERVEGIRLTPADERGACNAEYVVARVDGTTIARDTLLAVLTAENVMARRYFHPGCHRTEPYASRPAATPMRLPVTEQALAEVLVLPTGMAIDGVVISAICELIDFASRHADVIRSRLAAGEGTVQLGAL